jgi:putative endonuclease
MKYFIYAIYNRQSNKIYIGQTKDINFRLKIHNEKIFKGYTARYKGTWEVIYKEDCDSRQKALIRERQLKSFQGRKFVKNLIIPG